MNPLIRQRLHVLFFAFGGILLFAGVAFLGLPVYTMAAYEKVEATHEGTSYTESNGNSRFVYDIPRQSYTFTLPGGAWKRIGVHTREPAKKITVYFQHTPESDAEVNLRDDCWRNGAEVTVLLTIGIVLFVFGILGVLAGFVTRAMNGPPIAVPV
jgi:hypothetical protein